MGTKKAKSQLGCLPLGTMSPTEAAEIALRMLHSLAQLQPAVDAQGHNLQPLPAVHRILASPQCLPHIAQVLHHPSPVSQSITPSPRADPKSDSDRQTSLALKLK